MDLQVSQKFRWYVLITMFAATIAQGMALISPAPLVGEISKSMGLSLGEVTGALMGSFIIMVALSAVAGGIFTDKFGITKTYMASMVLLIIGSLLVPVLGEKLQGLLIARVIQGCGAGPIMGSISRLAAEWFVKKERAFVTGLQGAGVSLGVAVGFGLVSAVFAKTSDWQIAMAWMASGSVVALALSIGFALGPKSVIVPEGEADPNETEKSSAEFKKSLKLPVFWIGAFSAFLLSWAMQGYNDLTPGHLATDQPVGLGLGPVIAGQYMGLFQIAFMIGSIASGFFVHKLFGGKHKYVMSISFIFTGAFCVSVLLPLVHSEQAILLSCLILSGFFMGMPIATLMDFIANVYPEHITGRVGGATTGLSILGGAIGVAAGSFALHHSEMYTIPIIIVGTVCLFGFILTLGLNPPRNITN